MPIYKNHMIIGLGGTGGNIIRSFRKLVYQNFRRNDPDNVHIRYLYADTSDELMALDDPTWKILGHSVQLPNRSQLKMGVGMQLKDTVEQLASYPGISPWLGDRRAFAGIIESANAAHVVGAQKRRLGRFLFASHAAQFRDRVVELAGEMQTAQTPGIQRSTATAFHVCCGLAGGTGSGSVIDAISQIRTKFPDAEHQIILYALLPERQVAGGKGGPNYHANGYAALMELNALSIGSWRPHDITGVTPGRLTIPDPYNCCYLFNDENESGVKVDVVRELPDIVASFLFQKVVEIQNIHWGVTNTLMRQEMYEVGGQARIPEFSADQRRPVRARTFFSFGIKQVAYPEIEIREYLTYDFARQAALQLRFNRWIDGRGYVEEATNQGFGEFVKERSTLERWYLNEERLTLSEGILADERNNRKWRPISDFWKAVVPMYVNLVLEAKDDAMKMMTALTRRCDDVYEKDYRGEGVMNFYQTKLADMPAQAREIRGLIERDLFNDWNQGAKSMMDISSLLAALLEEMENRIKAMDGRIAALDDNSDNETKISNNRNAWAKLGPLSRLVGHHKNLLIAQSECLITRYTVRTRAEGLRHAKKLLATVKEEVSRLASEVRKCSTMVANVTGRFRSALDARCQNVVDGNEIDVKRDFSRQVVRFYDPKAVRDFSKTLVTDLHEQRRQTGKVRAELMNLLGENHSFASFNNRITEGKFIDVLESCCEQSVIEAHAEHVARNPDRERVLQVSLIEKMRREFEGNAEQLSRYAHDVVAMSKDFVKLDKQQVKLKQDGIPLADNPENAVGLTYLTIVAPEAREETQFRDAVCQAFRSASTSHTEVVTNSRRLQEITLVNITSGLSARMVDVVRALRAKYDGLIGESKTGRAFMELHLEGEAGRQLMDGQVIYGLYPESYKSSDFLPWIMLAEAIGLIRTAEAANTGQDRLYLYSKDEDGFEQVQDLGENLARVAANPEARVVEIVKTEVAQRLQTDLLHKTKRDALLEIVRTRVQQNIQGLASNDPTYADQREAFRRVKELLDVVR